jgi:PAS domain-containing protein
MLDMIYLDWVVGAFVSFVAAVTAVYWLTPRIRATGALANDSSVRDRVFLFDGSDLIEASAEAMKLVRTGSRKFDWAQLHDALSGRYPDFPKSPKSVQSQRSMAIPACDENGKGDVFCEWIDGIIRVHLREPDDIRYQTQAVTQELETLRLAIGQAPYPVWQVDSDSNVGWCNSAYEKLCVKVHGDNADMPSSLFPSVTSNRPVGKKTRTNVPVSNSEQKLWFDVTVAQQDAGYLCYAVDINAVVDAEVAQRNFVQTLTKTFAQLSIGLAIFDRNRQLALFNPALIDLTALPADFLSARPNLLSFFDRLRDQRMMPEPKNYGSWRHQMADLVAAAADGRYQETWSLPSGAVYSVNGRPHPDGAVAFLFQDITADITLTRRFRTDLEINQSMMDQLHDSIAVFSDEGGLTFSNLAYRKLWNVDPEASFVQMTILDAARAWQDNCQATPVLGEVRDFVNMRGNRTQWWAQVQLKTGQSLACGIFPVSHGATMVIFSLDTPENLLTSPESSSACPEPANGA